MTDLDRPGSERIIAFTDAVVAIAITVLMLPLAGLRVTDGNVLGMLQANAQLLGGLALTWLIIMLFWFAHHQIFRNVVAVDGTTMWLNFLWLFAIATLPLPVNIVVENDPSSQVTGLYVGWMALISLVSTLLARHVRSTPGLTAPGYTGSPEARTGQARSTLVTAVFILAFLMALVAPGIAAYFLFLLIPVDPIVRWWSARWT